MNLGTHVNTLEQLLLSIKRYNMFNYDDSDTIANEAATLRVFRPWRANERVDDARADEHHGAAHYFIESVPRLG